jgi:hypothetical protein
VVELRKQKNVSFMIPPERMQLVAEQRARAGEAPLPPASPTHEMAATFRSVTRRKMEPGQASTQRMEWYALEYRIEDLRSRELVWLESFDFKRLADGTIMD